MLSFRKREGELFKKKGSVHSEVKVGVARVGLNALSLFIMLWPGGGATNEQGHPERAIKTLYLHSYFAFSGG